MKKSVFSLIGVGILLFLFSSSKDINKNDNQVKTFTLNAEIDGITSNYLIYYEYDDTVKNGLRRDTIWIKDNKFTFTDDVDNYKIYFIDVPQASRYYKIKVGDQEFTASPKAFTNRMWFIGYPGAKISYKGKINGYMVDAYPSDKHGINDDLALIHKQVFPLVNQIDSITGEKESGAYSKEQKIEMDETKTKLYNKIIELRYNFIKSHPQSIAASYIFMDAFYRKYFTLEESKTLFKNFDSSKLKGTTFYDEAKTRFDAIENTQIGMQAPDLNTNNTLDGSEFKLSSLKGNYVLIDYWGTWCGPCMAEIPKIREYYKKYSDKNFVVLGVNSGDTKQSWEASLIKKEMSWMQIRSTKEHELLTPFNVNSFPTKILLDPQGKIIYSSKNTEEKIDLYQMLDQIFSKS